MLAVPALLGACAAEPGEEDFDEASEAIVRSTTFVVDARPGHDGRVEPGRLVFRRAGHEDLFARRAGDVIASGAGFLRRVRAVRGEGDSIVVDTAPASLEDAIEKGRVRKHVIADQGGSLAPRGFAPGAVKLGIGVGPMRLSAGGSSSIDVLEADFDYTPDLDLDLLVRRGAVERLKVVAGGATSAKMRVRFDLHKDPSAGAGFTVRFGKSGVELASLPPIRTVAWIGYVPVVVAIKVGLNLDYAFDVAGDAKGELDLDLGGALRAGIARDNGEWQTIGSSSFHVAPHGEVESPANVVVGYVTLTAKAAVSIYEVAGPYVGIQAYAGVGRERTPSADTWFGELGVRGVAGVEAGLFHDRLSVAYQVKAFDRSIRVPLSTTPQGP
jgi:hypothetical protein